MIGSGPAGLACASELRRRGMRVTIFEKSDRLGGVLGSTIPLYRFPSLTIMRDASWALGLPVRALAASRPAGRDGKGKAGHAAEEGGSGEPAGVDASASDTRVTLHYRHPVADARSLARKYDAGFLATGLGERAGSLPGDEMKGVLHAQDFLFGSRLMRYRNRVGREVVVIGGGNVACDAAMAAVRCGEVASMRSSSRGERKRPLVHLLYRRTRAEMPAWDRGGGRTLPGRRGRALSHPAHRPRREAGAGNRFAGLPRLSRNR